MVVLEMCLFHFWVRVVRKGCTTNVSEMGICQVPASVHTQPWMCSELTHSASVEDIHVRHASGTVKLLYAACFVLSLLFTHWMST